MEKLYKLFDYIDALPEVTLVLFVVYAFVLAKIVQTAFKFFKSK